MQLNLRGKENSVLTVMDFESCYERIWHAGLLKKSSIKGIESRLWLYIRNFLVERKYYITVIEYTSPVYKSPVTIGAIAERCKEFGKVHRSGMIKASGCLNSTRTEALEVLTNTEPIYLQLK